MLKSASQVVFVDGTITPIRFRMLMCHNLADWLICRSSNLTGGPMKLSVQSLTTGLEYHGEVEGKRQRYFVLSSARQYFVMSLSRSKRDSGNFNLVGKAAVERLYRRLRGKRGLTARLAYARSRGGASSDLAALNLTVDLLAPG